MKNYKVIASQIFIINLLSVSEKKELTAVPRMLHNKLLNMVDNNHIQGWDVEHHQCLCLNSLKELLQEIAMDNHGKTPIIHVVGHGSKEVFKINNTCYEWKELFIELREINKRTFNNLVLTLLACEGAYALRAATEALFQKGGNLGNVNGECPVYAMLSPDVKICACAAQVGFEAFYETLIYSRDLQDSVSAFENALNEMPKKVPFSCFLSDDEIEKALKSAVPKMCSKSNLERLIRQNFSNNNRVSDADVNAAVNAAKDNVRDGVNQTYKTFLMADCCEENRKRFAFDVDKLVNDSWDKP